MNFSKTLLLAAVACLAPVVGFADSVAVTTNPSLSIGGLNFSNFTCSVTKGGVIATPSNCGQINVGTITNPGVGISFSSGFTAMSQNVAFDDAVLGYNVMSKSGISAIGLDFNGWFDGLAISSVTESVYNGNQLVGYAKVSCGAFGGCTQTDNITLNGTYTNLFVQKDINVTAGNGVAQASYVDQTFAAAPEPGSIALMGSGLLAVAGLLRRRAVKK